MPKESFEGDVVAIRLLERLHGSLLSKPGRVKEVHEKAGLDPNYSRQRLRRGTMDLSKFCRLVEASGKEVAQFVVETLESSRRFGRRLLLPERPAGTEPELIRRVRALGGSDSKGSIPRTHLVRLDDLRYDDPMKARLGIESAIDYVEPADIPFALGIYASCSRALLQPKEAWLAILNGFELARGFDHLANRANLWQRASVIHLVSGDYGFALASSEKAMAGYARLGDLPRIGQTLIDQGTILWELGEFAETEAAFRSGLDLLAPTDRRNQCAARQFLAVLLRVRGKSVEALEMMSSAVPLAASLVEKGKVQWLQALCLADLGRIDEARLSFDEAFGRLMGPDPADATLLVCDQVRFMLEHGMLREALEQARAIRSLIIPLEERSPQIAAAASELAAVEYETSREVALSLVESVRKRIEKARRQQANGL